MKVTLVPQDQIAECWPQVVGLITQAVAVSGGRHTVRSTWNELRAGRQALWVAFEHGLADIVGVAVTAVTRYPAKTMLSIILLAGRDLRLWHAPLHAVVVRYANSLGLRDLEATGRDGWVRFSAQHGWRKSGVVLDLDLK